MNLAVHIEEWRAYAAEQHRLAEYEASRGHYAGVYTVKADLAERTATSLEMEEKTGVPHCPCCLKPVGAGIRLGRHVGRNFKSAPPIT